MRIATAAYPLDTFETWSDYAAKQIHWVREAARAGADLLVFPEYARMELATLSGDASDVEAAMHAAAHYEEEADRLMFELATGYGVHILCGSGPVFYEEGSRPRNRALLVGPDPEAFYTYTEKQIMTPYERETLKMVSGEGSVIIDTPLGKIGVLICYDSEFPALSQHLIDQGAEILLVPSCTETLHGHSRVRVAAAARALEGQCVTAVSALVGTAPWCPIVDVNTGSGAIFGPPETGFAETGVIASGVLDEAGWTLGDVDLSAIRAARSEGQVRNHADHAKSVFRAGLHSVQGESS
jgi:predicted amidohydrolase